MIIKQINLKPDCPDEVYTEFCEMTQRQGVFKACGNPDEKWIMVQFETEIDYISWAVATFMSDMKEVEIQDGT